MFVVEFILWVSYILFSITVFDIHWQFMTVHANLFLYKWGEKNWGGELISRL